MIRTTLRFRLSDAAAKKAKALELKKQGEYEMGDGNNDKAVATFLAAMKLDQTTKRSLMRKQLHRS